MRSKQFPYSVAGLGFLAALSLAIAATPALVRAAQQRTDVVPIASTHASLSAQWWQWILGIPAASNPGLDATGQFCGVNQSGAVWFLAGTFDTTPVIRSCAVPPGHALFLPLLNGGAFPDPGDTADVVRRQAAAVINAVNTLHASVDGRVVDDLFGYRILSPVFSFVVPDGGLLNPGLYAGAVSDGYWLLIRPLKPGKHVIHFGGAQSGIESPFAVDVTYDLTIPDSQ